ncbi:hypothetical protein AB832_01420 [Flavobacteriaceae bacterium (ex Bugula neritina AB1)]|nr:hypothetical protein AB832_01420 [Flavobacteriaceae bacterium (ex Bugula neritina AB1)]
MGLYNYKARTYDPAKRIFLQPDPKHVNYSPYTYANNNPINFMDVTGEAPLWVLDHREDGALFNQVTEAGGIPVKLEDVLKGRNLPNLKAAGFDGTITLGAHGSLTNTSKLYTEFNLGDIKGSVFGHKVSKVGKKLGAYVKESGVTKLDLNLGVCYTGSCKPNGKSFINNIGQSLADHSNLEVNAVGFKGAVSYSGGSGADSRFSPYFKSYHPDDSIDEAFNHYNGDDVIGGSRTSSRSSLNRSLNATKAYPEEDSWMLRPDSKPLGPYGVNRTFTPRGGAISSEARGAAAAL